MRRLIKIALAAALLGIIIMLIFYFVATKYHDELYVYYRDNIKKVQEKIKLDKNDYYKGKNYGYVQITDDFVAKDKKHLLNIFYTVIDSGQTNFTFYCSKDYTNCNQDVVELIDNKEILSNVNNFVHPYNSFEKINTSYDNFGEVNIKIDKIYSDEDIKQINDKISQIEIVATNSSMTNVQKITAIHNYIINHGRYASDTIRKQNPNKNYNKANDILFDGYGLCSSYADTMAIFLNKWKIDNYRIASDTHIWNLVNIDGKWLHLDLTWDDPITQDGKDKLENIFLLIDNERLKKLKIEKHDYNQAIYQEAQ